MTANINDNSSAQNVHVSIDLCIDDESWTGVSDLEKKITLAVKAALSRLDMGTQPVGLTIVLGNNQRVKSLNAEWRDKQKPTNILSFPAPAHSKTDTGQAYLGDLILAYGVIFDEANEQRKPLATHLCHLIIHGVLHLLGFDHQNDDEAHDMEQMEIEAMATLGLSNPYQISGQINDE